MHVVIFTLSDLVGCSWQTIVEYEKLLIGLGWWDPDGGSGWWKRGEKDKKKFPRYMVIAQEAKGEVLSVADGVTGRIRKHLTASADGVTAHVDGKIDNRIDALDDKIDALDDKIDASTLKSELQIDELKNELLAAIAALG